MYLLYYLVFLYDKILGMTAMDQVRRSSFQEMTSKVAPSCDALSQRNRSNSGMFSHPSLTTLMVIFLTEKGT